MILVRGVRSDPALLYGDHAAAAVEKPAPPPSSPIGDHRRSAAANARGWCGSGAAKYHDQSAAEVVCLVVSAVFCSCATLRESLRTTDQRPQVRVRVRVMVYRLGFT